MGTGNREPGTEAARLLASAGTEALGRFGSQSPVPGSHCPVRESCRRDLFPRMIARSDQRAGLHVSEAYSTADPCELPELVRRVIPIERKVIVRRAQVLAERQNIDIDRAKVAHDSHDFLDSLT